MPLFDGAIHFLDWGGRPDRASITAMRRLADRLAGHLQVQPVAVVRMLTDDRLVELDPEARLSGRDDVTGLPADGLHQHLRMKALPALDALENEEVGAAGGELDVRCAHHRAAVKVRGELHVIDLRECGDLLRLENAAHPP